MESAAAPRTPDDGRAVLEVLTEDECFALLADRSVGRVGVTIGAMPAILPVNYALHGRTVVFRTAEGTKLQAAIQHAVVAFEVDDIDEREHRGWSVLVVGMATELTGARREEALALPLEPWAPHGRDHVVAIAADLVSGRRLVPGRG